MILVPIFRRLNHHRNLCTTRSSFILRKEPKPNRWLPNDGNIKYYMAIGLIPTGKKHVNTYVLAAFGEVLNRQIKYYPRCAISRNFCYKNIE